MDYFYSIGPSQPEAPGLRKQAKFAVLLIKRSPPNRSQIYRGHLWLVYSRRLY